MRLRILIGAALLLTGAFAQADVLGTANFKAMLSRSYFGYDMKHEEGKLTGGFFFTGRSPFVNVTKDSGGRWSGFFGGYNVIVKPAQVAGSTTTVDVTILQIGQGTYTIEKAEDGSYQIRGFGTPGRLIIGGLKSGELSLLAPSVNYGLRSSGEGRFEGLMSVYSPVFQSGNVTLNTTGSLDPTTLIESNPELFTLLYLVSFAGI
ncbi:MAG: hypothetical protein COT74_01075 [Bdellovibrionales bacterium CG10_big_fil_rev_8_21_14_0_10_45_34]|nr:MAG: hypothetical protein COT74_01075 [Bdellovibrionales bacterium CG10_big_fil_rev_8_21_14_0_10_45_34]